MRVFPHRQEVTKLFQNQVHDHGNGYSECEVNNAERLVVPILLAKVLEPVFTFVVSAETLPLAVAGVTNVRGALVDVAVCNEPTGPRRGGAGGVRQTEIRRGGGVFCGGEKAAQIANVRAPLVKGYVSLAREHVDGHRGLRDEGLDVGARAWACLGSAPEIPHRGAIKKLAPNADVGALRERGQRVVRRHRRADHGERDQQHQRDDRRASRLSLPHRLFAEVQVLPQHIRGRFRRGHA
mmetsp:Transcript_53/g.161  ORF Transcript_53/g.161 Transcript_53/m.161 type:complete len:238 (-) Transcript_53:1707-2420(-)